MKSVVITASSIETVLHTCKNILIEQDFRNVGLNVENGYVTAETNLSWRSLLGEYITIHVAKLDNGKFNISVISEAKPSLQIYDWGANERNVNNIINAIKKR